MFCIRTRSGMSPLILREDLSSSSKLHKHLHVLMRNGEIRSFPFHGFIHLDNVYPLGAQFVKVLYVEAFSSDGEFSKFCEIPNFRNFYIVGMWTGTGVKVCLYSNSPRSHPLPDDFEEKVGESKGCLISLDDYRLD